MEDGPKGPADYSRHPAVRVDACVVLIAKKAGALYHELRFSPTANQRFTLLISYNLDYAHYAQSQFAE